MIYIIHKMLVLLKNHLKNYLKDSICEYFLKELDRFFLEKFLFSYHKIMNTLSLEKENITKDIRNTFRLKKTKLQSI